jgi:hypothetical protein
MILGCLLGKTVYFYCKCGEHSVKTVIYRRLTGQQPDVDRGYTLALPNLSATDMIRVEEGICLDGRLRRVVQQIGLKNTRL